MSVDCRCLIHFFFFFFLSTPQTQGDGGPRPKHPVKGGIGYYYLGQEKKLVRCDFNRSDFRHLHRILHRLGDLDIDACPADLTLEQYLQEQKIPPSMMALAEAGYANTLCSNLKNITLRGAVAVEKGWAQDGGADYAFCLPVSVLIEHLKAGFEIRTNWIVHQVEWNLNSSYPPTSLSLSLSSSPSPKSSKCRLTSACGQVIEADQVILALPITVLRDNDIKFSPPLPVERVEAAGRIVMEPSMKIIMRFSRPFWPVDFQGVICGDCVIPEFWVKEITSDALARSEFVVTCFTTSNFTRRLTSLPVKERDRQILAQFDEIFGASSSSKSTTPTSSASSTPATDAFINSMYMDWSCEPFIRGGYSSPSPELHRPGHDRLLLATPLANRLFFAGEYTRLGFSTMNAATDSGLLAANHVLKSRNIPYDCPVDRVKIKPKL